MKSEKGFSLMEVMLSMALLGIVAVAILSALSTGSQAIFIADERATAESLARSQMEYVRNQAYSSAPWNYTVTSSERSSTDQPSWYDAANNPPLLSSNYDGYTVTVSVVPLHLTDDGLQRVTVTVDHANKLGVIILEGYRSLR